jgi:2-amino-4-hydroxy-6-hydroxymethyldihydropteridine diphosphokinase
VDLVVLHLGSNMDDRLGFLSQAILLLEEKIGKILKKSSIYETEAWGVKGQDDFLNQAILLSTKLEPKQLLNATQDIENQLGRRKEEQWGSRVIDIDILAYGSKIIKTESLTIPHPLISQRNFVLVPFMEIEPYLILPGFELNIEELYEQSKDNCDVWLYDDTSNG